MQLTYELAAARQEVLSGSPKVQATNLINLYWSCNNNPLANRAPMGLSIDSVGASYRHWVLTGNYEMIQFLTAQGLLAGKAAIVAMSVAVAVNYVSAHLIPALMAANSGKLEFCDKYTKASKQWCQCIKGAITALKRYEKWSGLTPKQQETVLNIVEPKARGKFDPSEFGDVWDGLLSEQVNRVKALYKDNCNRWGWVPWVIGGAVIDGAVIGGAVAGMAWEK